MATAVTHTDQDCFDALDRAVLGLFSPTTSGLKEGIPSTFLSTLYCGMRRVIDRSIPTACTNGHTIRFNPDWYCPLSPPMRLTVLAHELWHVAFQHILRVGDRHRRRWNAACDYAINWMLHEHGFQFDRDAKGKVIGLLDKRFADMSAEQIYKILDEEKSEIPLPFGEDFEVLDAGADDDVSTDIVRNIVRAVTMARMSGEAGKLPGDLVTELDRLLNPQLPWEILLRRWLDEFGPFGYDWRRPSRRHAASELYLPSSGSDGRLSRLLWGFDTSGSMRDSQVRVCVSEMAGAKERLRPRHMTVVNFDTKIQGTWEFGEEDELQRLKFTGRGGTNLQPLWDLATQLKPKAMVVLSDLCCTIPPPIPGVEVLWVCLDNPGRKVDYGHIIHVDSESPSTA